MIIKELTPFSKRNNYIGIGQRIRYPFIYKYMPVSTAEICLKNNNVRFSKPSTWKDPFEALFYTANYNSVMPLPPINTNLFAYCVTSNPECEAAWQMYQNQERHEPCVRFKIYLGQFRNFIYEYIYPKGTAYEGKVDYNLTGKKIISLCNPKNKLYTTLFEQFNLKNYLNLLLLKRPFFKYEEEIRFLIQTPYNSVADYIYIPLSWSQCLHSIQLPPDCPDELKIRIKEALKFNLKKCKNDYPQYHYRGIPIIDNPIYANLSHITIQRIP
ncbi:MAG: hypothetical protein K2H60_11635 [Muribaculaceae bacterium]|nr:hypothetical protein [Muribaculaceae bacterium]